MAQYELIFAGELETGFALAEVKQNLTALFKANPAQVDQMFSGKMVVLKNRLDEATARKYLAILKKNGARVKARPMGASPAPVSDNASTTTPSAPPANEGAGTAALSRSEAAAANTGGRIAVSGGRVDELVEGLHWDIAPVGSRMQEENTESEVASFVADFELAPAGSDLGQKKSAPPPPAPDTSHLKLKDQD